MCQFMDFMVKNSMKIRRGGGRPAGGDQPGDGHPADGRMAASARAHMHRARAGERARRAPRDAQRLVQVGRLQPEAHALLT